MNMEQDLQMAHAIAQRVAEAGGRVYFVGGYVRDQLLHRENKDIDIEIHGISPQRLEAILDELGQRKEMGASFGIYSLRHYGVDIAFPRSSSGETAPFIGTEAAAQRRDLTINALMQDVLTDDILDHFGGQADLQQGILRHVHPVTFGEDPLRVLRTAQFSARFGFRVAEETEALCASLPVEGLAFERVFGELEKALLKAERPSLFFDVLRRMNQLRYWFPEIEALIGVEQEAAFHPEGDAWNHTMLVLDAAASLRGQAKNPLGLMLAALCHDLGKSVSTQVIDGRIRSLGHETAGVPLTGQLLSRLTKENKLKKYVLNMVELHMRPNLMADQHSSSKAMCRMFDQSICPEDLLLLAKADRMGQLRECHYEVTEASLRQHLAHYHELMALPYVMGSDLVQAGFAPGKAMGEALQYAHKLRLAGVPKDSALRQTIGFLRSRK